MPVYYSVYCNIHTKALKNGLAQIHVFKDFTWVVDIPIYDYHSFSGSDNPELSSSID